MIKIFVTPLQGALYCVKCFYQKGLFFVSCEFKTTLGYNQYISTQGKQIFTFFCNLSKKNYQFIYVIIILNLFNKSFTLSGFSFRYGGSPSIISIAIIPKLQMSTLGPYCFRVTTSGAIQYGVPTMVERFCSSGVIVAQKPKSAVKISIYILY